MIAVRLTVAAILLTMPLAPALARADAEAVSPARLAIPDQLDAAQRDGYRAVFLALREKRWLDAQIALDAIKPGPLHIFARAQLYTAKGSPRVELDPLLAVLNEATELPQAGDLVRLAKARGATTLPDLPEQQRLIWFDGAPTRAHVKSAPLDMTSAALALRMQPFIRDDNGPAAQALLDQTQGLSEEALTGWRQKIAWIYYASGDDASARVVAAKAKRGDGDWAVQGSWIGALAAWRQGDCTAAARDFTDVTARAGDIEMRATALYWGARADMMCGRFDKVEPLLKSAAALDETFYGLLARQALGMRGKTRPFDPAAVDTDWAGLGLRPNVRAAAALIEIGETELADQLLRQQARIGPPAEFGALVRVADALDLPQTLMFLGHNAPVGVTAPINARYPAPRWTPDNGWRVDKALVYAHALQESRFRTNTVSQAGAYGLMQIMPAAAIDYARARGLPSVDRSALAKPTVNMAVGQASLERLRDRPETGGLLPKVIAAYNAGPQPVSLWNATVNDGGDPLLYIESLPYWETRGYVTMVLRNYWMYEAKAGKSKSASREALTQGLWPRFPGLPGPAAVKVHKALARPVSFAERDAARTAAANASIPTVIATTASPGLHAD